MLGGGETGDRVKLHAEGRLGHCENRLVAKESCGGISAKIGESLHVTLPVAQLGPLFWGENKDSGLDEGEAFDKRFPGCGL